MNLPPAATDAARLGAIGWRTAVDPEWQALLDAHPAATPARVVEQHRSGYVVATGPGEGVAVESLPEWQRPSGYRKGTVSPEERPAVGDWVLVEDGKRIVALLPRRGAIKRGAAGEHYRQQLIAANVDVVLVVCGLDGDFNPRRIERYLLLVQGSGATPVLVLTKADRPDADAAAAREALAGIEAQHVAVVAVNAKDPATVDALAPWLRPGETAVLVGSSGAGKSTVTNTLLGIEKMKTSAVREHDARGRHTTTHRALIALPSGACIIDTPGMRELKPTGEEEIADGGFGDIEALAEACRFRDCAHQKEPGCAVRAAIERGELDEARFGNYLKLKDEIAAASDRLASRLADKQGAKVQTRALHKRPDDKYGKR
ncbi:ribosome small subunit-dependent GTPase A [Luteimonas aestuarii]|uniref:Small ribosomal subunit biogenesis GTPase RsgA n=1 Tax=Luteimonas aestuarii TaxID=453837 RepID=A0A4R5TSW4_9GAMM|nr:ribosome small subunit-dependent GTPase A [Luteimonas aestuarii]